MANGKVLVIDDEEDVREVLKLHLEGEGYNCMSSNECGTKLEYISKRSQLYIF